MMVTAKFKVTNREPGPGPEGADGCTVVTMYPDYADERNKAWAWATPAGDVSLTIRNTAPAADFFELGKSLLVTFEES